MIRPRSRFGLYSSPRREGPSNDPPPEAAAFTRRGSALEVDWPYQKRIGLIGAAAAAAAAFSLSARPGVRSAPPSLILPGAVLPAGLAATLPCGGGSGLDARACGLPRPCKARVGAMGAGVWWRVLSASVSWV